MNYISFVMYFKIKIGFDNYNVRILIRIVVNKISVIVFFNLQSNILLYKINSTKK